MNLCRQTVLLLFVLTCITTVSGEILQSQPRELSPSPCCGPVSCYITLRYLGVDCTLEEVSDLCGYKDKPVKLLDLCRALKSFTGIRYFVKSSDPIEIERYLSVPNTVVLIALDAVKEDKGGLGHVFVLPPKKDGYSLVDYPKVIDNYDLRQLPDNMFSKCIVVRKSSFSLKTKYFYPLVSAISLSIFGIYLIRRKKFLLFTMCLVLNASTIYGANVSIDGNKKSFDIDLGFMEYAPGKSIVEEISIKNESDAPILIFETLVSCSSCIKPLNIPQKIEAKSRETAKFEITINKKNGRIDPVAVLKTNTGNYIFAFKGNIRSVWPDSAILKLGEVRLGSVEKKELMFFQAGFTGVKIIEIICSDESITYEKKEAKKQKKTNPKEHECFAKLDIDINFSKSRLGIYDENIRIKTNIDGYTDILIPVKAYIVGKVKIVPSEALFIRRNPQESLTRKVRIKFDSTTTLSIENIALMSDNPGLWVSIIKVNNDDKILDIEITLLPNTQIKSILHGDVIGKYMGEDIFMIPYSVIAVRR